MLDIGKALAGVPFMSKDGQMPAKYITPFSEMIKGIVNECKKAEQDKLLEKFGGNK